MSAWDDLNLLTQPAAIAGGSAAARQRTRRLLDEVTSLTLVKSTRTYWRGLSDASYRLDPSILHHDPANAPSSLKEVHDAADGLIEDANAGSHLWRDGISLRGLHDLETLALLQHFGVATPLLDLTADQLVALYFAVRSHDNKDGLLVGWNAMKWMDLTGFEQNYAAAISWLVADDTLGMMVPPVMSDRVVVQRSRMLVAPVIPRTMHWARSISSMRLPNLPPSWSQAKLRALFARRGAGRRAMPAVVGFHVPRGLKPYIRAILRDSFGIEHITLFPDPAGYAERPPNTG